MPHTIDVTLLSDGPKKAQVHFYFESDGSPELVNFPILDPLVDFTYTWNYKMSDDGTYRIPPTLTILQAWTSASWFDMTIGFDSAIPTQSLVLARDSEFYMDFRSFGGIKDRSKDISSQTGKIILSTKDFQPVGSNGFLVLDIRKD